MYTTGHGTVISDDEESNTGQNLDANSNSSENESDGSDLDLVQTSPSALKARFANEVRQPSTDLNIYA